MRFIGKTYFKGIEISEDNVQIFVPYKSYIKDYMTNIIKYMKYHDHIDIDTTMYDEETEILIIVKKVDYNISFVISTLEKLTNLSELEFLKELGIDKVDLQMIKSLNKYYDNFSADSSVKEYIFKELKNNVFHYINTYCSSEEQKVFELETKLSSIIKVLLKDTNAIVPEKIFSGKNIVKY